MLRVPIVDWYSSVSNLQKFPHLEVVPFMERTLVCCGVCDVILHIYVYCEGMRVYTTFMGVWICYTVW